MTALEKTLPLLLIFAVAFSLKKAKILHKEDGRVVSKLVTWVIVPATVINSLVGMTIEPGLMRLPLAAVSIVAVLLCLSFLLAPLLGLRGKTRAAFLIGFPTLSLGSIGFAFMFAAFGPDGLAFLVIFDMGHAFCLFVCISLLASVLGKGREQFHLRDALLRFVQNPILWSYAIGVVINLTHIHSVLLSSFLSILSQGFVFLAMVIVALEFEIKLTSISLPLLAIYIKLAAGVTVGLLISFLFGLTGMERITVVLGASLPVSLFTVVYAKEYNLDASFLASMISIALPISLVFCSLFLLIVH